MPLLTEDIWSVCRRQNGDGKVSFSLELPGRQRFNFHLSPSWPADKIRQALSLNAAPAAEEGWSIYGLTTAEFDCHASLRQYPRDQFGRLDLPNTATLAFYDDAHKVLRVYDFASRRAAYVCDAALGLAAWECYSPFREFWHFWALKNDALLIHSGLVSNGNTAVLLPGKGGKGKSTTVLSCLEHGMKTTGDDYNLLLRDGAHFVAVPLYGLFKQKDTRRFEIAQDWAYEKASYADKTIYYPPAGSGVWDKSLPRVSGILCPEIQTSAAIRPIGLAPLINELAMSSIMQSPVMAQAFLSRTVQLAKSTRHATLALSPHAAENADAIKGWMETLAAVKEKACA